MSSYCIYTELYEEFIVSKHTKLNKTSLKKINDYLKTLDTDEQFKEDFVETVKRDVIMIKDCSEKSIVDFYLETAEEINIDDEDYFEKLKGYSRAKLANKYASSKTFDDTIDMYFNDVKREYILHPQGESDELEFIPENRDLFIKNNLKLVVNCAKRYRNLGLSFRDLIQIGNYGLLMAWEKFDTSRANLRNDILNDIKSQSDKSFSKNDATTIIKRNFKYSKTLETTLSKLPDSGFDNKEDFIDWAQEHIKKASFSSIAFSWIRAMILLELNNASKIIKIPKSVQQDDEQTVNIIRLDSVNPHTDDVYHDNQISEIANEEFAVEDESMEKMEQQNLFKGLVDKLLFTLPALDRRIIKKRFGIDVPYQLSINEIAENEGITSNKVKYIITNALKVISNNIPEKDKETIIEMLM